MSSEEREKFYEATAQALPVKHVADADEIAHAYLFLMKYVKFVLHPGTH